MSKTRPIDPMLVLRGLSQYSNDNLHLIAISNLKDDIVKLRRWWSKKYNRPLKEFDDYTYEELVVEMLEDFYEKNPTEADRFMDSVGGKEWDGKMPEEYEKEIRNNRKNFFKKNQVDLSKWQTDSDFDEEDIIENLGKSLPKSKVDLVGGGEFDDDFGV